ncbi:MAG: hypothetical protein E7623_02725 [Ruminococcaceae bacterium]|nr:hypothetical protein [Oscillospiraceae bacterium]
MKAKAYLKKMFKDSFFVFWLSKFVDLVYKEMKNSAIGGFLTKYDVVNDKVKKSFIYKTVSKIFSFKGWNKRIKQSILRGCENSLILWYIKRVLSALFSGSVKTYGIFLSSSGIYTALVYLLSRYAFPEHTKGEEYLICGALMIIASIPMFFSSEPLSVTVCDSKIIGFIVSDMLGIRRSNFEQENSAGGRGNVAFVAGIAFGILSFFVSPTYIIAAAVCIVGLVVILGSPETGVVALFLLLPFLSTMQLVALTACVAMSFVSKLIRGKRTIKLHSIDILVLLFMLVIALGGIVSVSRGDSIKSAMVFVCFMLGYFLTVNLIKTEEWVKRCVLAVSTGAVVVSLVGIYENFFGTALSIWHDEEMFEGISGRVVSTFENPNVLGEYLVMCVPFLFTAFICTKSKNARLGAFVCSLVCGACLIYTWSRGAWLGFAFALIIYLLIWSKKAMLFMCFGVFALPLIPLVLPDSIAQRIGSIGNLTDTSTAYRVNIWKGTVNMISELWVGGIGIGTSAFSRIYTQYSLSGIERAPHAHNLYLQIIAETGIVGILIFLGLIVIFAQSCLSFYTKDCINGDAPDKRAKMVSAAAFCGIAAVLLQGMTDYIWYNYRVFFMFWLIMGLAIAARRSFLFEKPKRVSSELCIDIPYRKAGK